MLFWFLVVGMHVFWGYFHVPAAWAVRRLQTVVDSFRKSFQEPCELKMEIPAIQFYLTEGVFFFAFFVCLFFSFLFSRVLQSYINSAMLVLVPVSFLPTRDISSSLEVVILGNNACYIR